MSKALTLNQGWHFTKENNGIPTTATGDVVAMPHTWNAVDGQDGGNDYYRGTCWYTLDLPKPEIPAGGRAVLQFDGAAMSAVVYLNGKKLAEHKGGYSTFRVDITDELAAENLLAVSVDNSDNDTVYPQKADFTFYGGLYRDVTLHIVPAVHFALWENGAPALHVTPIVTNLQTKTAEITVEAAAVGAQTVDFVLEGKHISAAVENGVAKAVFTLEHAHLWDGIDDPYLYSVTAKLDNGEMTSTRFGCRKFEIDPQQGFFLNGRSYPLRGVSHHQDRKDVGNVLTRAMMEEDMNLILEMGANTIRLAHYQHAQAFYDLCDEKGIVVWAEIPYITQHMTNGRANTLTQMEELIVQNYNHPSIAVWGLSNETTAASAVSEDLLENHRQLNDLAHRLDPTRPTTMANVFMLETTSPILEIPDVNSYNLYFGWYLGDLVQNEQFFDKYHADYPDRCIGFSEYGADANPAYQSATPEKGDYTETYQCVYHEHMVKMIEERPWLWATHVWNMFDFAADGRDEGGKHGENQKGLVTFDRKLKKDAFYLYKAYWSKEPFIHLCGSRYRDRTEDVTEIKVYTNQPSVTLYKDHELVETKQGDKVFTFQLPITGSHWIEVHAGSFSDAIVVNKVDRPNPAYSMDNRKDVNNWFDGELDPSCWSIKDNMAAAMADPKVGPMLQQMTKKAASSRGDVATAVKDNPALKAMMARAMKRMTIESILQQAGADAESIRQLNRVLQTIKRHSDMRTTYCNPLDLNYRYQHLKDAEKSVGFREGADPTLVYFKGNYYLFVSMSAGFWYSEDLLHWAFHADADLLIYDYAPDVRQVGEYLYFCASRRGQNCPILRTADPLHEPFTEVNAPFPFWDPDLFCDDDGRVYLYWGCSNTTPIYGVEMDPETMQPIGEPKELIFNSEETLGYERPGDNGVVNREASVLYQTLKRFYDPETNRLNLPPQMTANGYPAEALTQMFLAVGKPYIEGAFMTKHAGTYYLQYACPGTQYNTYADGVYTAKSPLGPFTLQKSNPFSSKPGGFMTGAGHGSTIQDEYGNWWHASTMRISANHDFERRVGLFPAGFDQDGVLFCNQNFADYPHTIPAGKFDAAAQQPEWMLLSYKKPVTASSTAVGSDPALAVNEDSRTWWSAGTNKPGQWLCVDLQEVCDIWALQINFADEALAVDFAPGHYGGEQKNRHIETIPQYTEYSVAISDDGNVWRVIEGVNRECSNAYHEYPQRLRARYLRVTAEKLPYGQPLRISGLRVFGNGNGTPPPQAQAAAVRKDDLDAVVTWQPIPGTQGCNVRYGIAPDKLYQSWLVYDATEVTLSTLIAGQKYYVCVDSFNENGITPGNVMELV